MPKELPKSCAESCAESCGFRSLLERQMEGAEPSGGARVTLYPRQEEILLQQAIRDGDSVAAKELLDRLFVAAYAYSGGELEAIKRYVTELMVIVSRASVHSGADVREIFGNNDYIRDIQRFCTVEQLYDWAGVTLRRFMDYTFEFQQIKHCNALYRAQSYIREHYAEKLTLEGVAAQTFLSPGYLSSLFKDETGETVVEFINRTRVNAAKKLLTDNELTLVEIAQRCGFDDQSYFARVFKRVAGVSPGKFRVVNSRV